ncbi:hypothetical protein CEXT_145971 [Caerostris extrusa]|uniref:Uncharacterized protein n=1 Tax=Caerostris extrusa TaxID=172846 RepID=A0AAV4VBU1_CAEEX|nr:hypothetical protein CEXT_145971 [Caerostris extrusa]
MTPETSTSRNLIDALRQQDLRPLVFEEFKHSFWQVERVLRGESFKATVVVGTRPQRRASLPWCQFNCCSHQKGP